MSDLAQSLLALAGAADGGFDRFRRGLNGLLGELVSAADGDMAAARDTLGMHNQRLLRLHQRLCGEALEACVSCPACAERIEFDVPTEHILALPAPATDARLKLGDAVFRLPRIADFTNLALSDPGEHVSLQLARSCLVEGAPEFSATLFAELGERFEQADPAGNISLALTCGECGTDFSVAVDVAPLVADAFVRVADGLLRDIDTIASAYGWSEDEILALPTDRRRLYVALIAARRRPGGARPQAAELAK